MLPDPDFRSVATSFLSWNGYCWLAQRSSEIIRLIAAWASVKIVTYSGTVGPDADSSALATAASS